MYIFYIQTKKKALILMPVWQRTDSWVGLYRLLYVFCTKWYCKSLQPVGAPVGALYAAGAMLLASLVLLALSTPATLFSSCTHLTCLLDSMLQSVWLVPKFVDQAFSICIVVQNFSLETYRASLFPSNCYLHCKWQRTTSWFFSFSSCFSLHLIV